MAPSNRTMPPCAVIPELAYEDVGEAIDWLCATLGFSVRWRAGDHRAQLSFAGGTVVITERGASAPPERQSLMVRVEDAGAHHDHARARGATIVQGLEDFPYGERQYTVEDPGGHRWTFSQSIADLAPEAWGGTSGPALERELAGASGLAISVMLIVPDAQAAASWYEDALGATRLWDLGSVVGMVVGGAPFFLHAVNPDNPAERSPGQIGVTSTRIEVFLDDPDGFLARAIAAGAGAGSELTDHAMPWGTHRQGGFLDPYGHRWLVGDRSPLGRHPR